MAKKYNFQKFSNIAITYQEKYKDPDGKENIYFVPRVDCQCGKNFNYIIVACSPGYNGMYKYPCKNRSELKVWYNKKLPVYYISTELTGEPMGTLDEMYEHKDDPTIACLVADIIKQQTDGINGRVYNHPYVYKSIPDWCLPGVKLNGEVQPERIIFKEQLPIAQPAIPQKVQLW